MTDRNKKIWDASPSGLLTEMFHSNFFEEETVRICPVCKQEYMEHMELAYHMIRMHPEYSKKYVSDLDEMLRDPMFYFSVEADYADAEVMCRICGTDFQSEGELKRHLRLHSKTFEDFKNSLQSNAARQRRDFFK